MSLRKSYRPDSGRPEDLYCREFLGHMKGQEMRLYKRFFRKSPQLDFRQTLVNWIVMVGERSAKLKLNTLHLAVKLLDFFMDGHNIQQEKLYLVAMASLTIAAKFDEKESKVPKLSHLIDCTPVELQDDFRNTDSVKNHGFLEAMILNYFDWNVFLPTSSSFAAVILPQVLKDTDLYQDQAITFEQMEQINLRSQFSELLRYFLRLSIVDSNYIEVKPSIMGCSAVYACRHVFGLSPVWPPRLRDLVGLDEADLIDCAFVLIDTHQRALSGQIGVEGGCGVIGHTRRPLPPSFKRKPTAKPAASTLPVAKQSRKKAKVTAIVEVVDDEEKVEIKRKKERTSSASNSKQSAKKPTTVSTKAKGKKRKSEDEGYGSFFDQSGGSSRNSSSSTAKNVDMLIRSSEVLEATEKRHQSFKQEIKEEILGTNSC